MATIKQLLNPEPEPKGSDSDFEPVASRVHPDTDDSSEYGSRKRLKLGKDAAIFTPGDTRGQCRYPPCEINDDFLSKKHEAFQMYPVGIINLYPRHIPYSSDKKDFLEKTGRVSLEVFQYEFKVPGNDTTYTMLWDYNIGLVRTTPLFKCTGHSKTTPAKMLNRNAGLRDICHSITGGALVAQGYWIPFEAARAIAATFCWKIRYALTPVFGADFPFSCFPPDHPKYGDMTIDPAITKKCTQQARTYRAIEIGQSRRHLTVTPELKPFTPVTPESQISKTFSLPRSEIVRTDYNSDSTVGSIEVVTSPTMPYRTIWSHADTPRSVPDPAPPPYVASTNVQFTTANTKQDISSAVSPSSISNEIDEGYDGDSSSTENISEHAQENNHTSAEMEAAYTLYSMSCRGAKNMAENQPGHRRASI